MIGQAFNLVAALWGHIGPGLALAAALPILLLAFGLIVLGSVKKLGSSENS
jgi:hypothetical protein